MIQKHLGPVIDIHGGGSDLTFPHHENEAAQSRCVHNADFVRYWLHNGMLTMGQEKMSKSVGNVVTIKELRERYSGEILRYALLSGQYRSQLAWSDDLLLQAQSSLDRLYGALREAPDSDTALDYRDAPIAAFPSTVVEVLCDDLNTPQALAALHQIAGEIHRTEDAQERKKLREQMLAGGWLLGLLTENAEAYFKGSADLAADDIERMIEARNQARQDKDYAGADAIRDELLSRGIELEDTREGTRWKVLVSRPDQPD
jgi:cysteinyl-tRNA synthetase